MRQTSYTIPYVWFQTRTDSLVEGITGIEEFTEVTQSLGFGFEVTEGQLLVSPGVAKDCRLDWSQHQSRRW